MFASVTVVVHFLFIVFILCGFVFNLYGILFNRKLLDCFYLRTLHLAGIIFVFSLEAEGKYCPLTLLENHFYIKSGSSPAYAGSFIIHYLEKLIYPDVNPMLIIIPTGALTAATLLLFIFHPPKKESSGTCLHDIYVA